MQIYDSFLIFAASLRNMKKIVFLLISLIFLATSCETFDHWLFNASDYHIVKSNNDVDVYDMELYWDDLDADIWYDELEYD